MAVHLPQFKVAQICLESNESRYIFWLCAVEATKDWAKRKQIK